MDIIRSHWHLSFVFMTYNSTESYEWDFFDRLKSFFFFELLIIILKNKRFVVFYVHLLHFYANIVDMGMGYNSFKYLLKIYLKMYCCQFLMAYTFISLKIQSGYRFECIRMKTIQQFLGPFSIFVGFFLYKWVCILINA